MPALLLTTTLVTACVTSAPVAGNGPDYWSPQELVCEDRVYSPTIHTVQFFKKGFELAPPVIELGAQDPLVLRFDDLQPNPEQLTYSIVHCDAQWRPSDLMTNQYITGSPTDYVDPAEQSRMTLQPFIEYTLELPNEFMRPAVAGNYLLKVYRNNDPDDLVLTRRFLVFEQRLDVQASIQASRDVERRDIAQQLDLTIRHPGITIRDPFSDISVTVLQNMRWDDARTGFKPKFLRDNELVYDHPKEGLFLGGSEWRTYDLKNTRYVTNEIKVIAHSPDGLLEVFLLPDVKRNIRVYVQEPDLNGKLFVRNDQMDGDPLGADYTWVNFTLPLDAPVASGGIYVYGGLTDFQCQKDFRMTWTPEEKAYTLRAKVKQGFVNYCYAYLPPDSDVPDLTTIEGSHFQTENDYLVLVYVKDYALHCDRLVGVRFVNSRRG
ncbi:MAG TPA: DUF5103 domain-containing protein [Flavobacteriales bacterium]|nr:DUF5103 domain-containing protein [Flavobacteriales bacterium]HNO05875.1 DUF5103 domain-containing protein [Flavobacteriales bacterium]